MSHQPDSSIIRIFSRDGRVVGAGFLADDKHVMTCAHVIAQALNLDGASSEIPSEEIVFDFPLVAPKKKLNGKIIAWHPVQLASKNKIEDIAVIETTDVLPSNAQPAILTEADDLWNHEFRAFGFPDGHDDGVWADGKLKNKQAGKWIQIEDEGQTGYGVVPGFSGGPVWDETMQAVVGMVVVSDKQAERKAAFIISAETLAEVWPELRQRFKVSRPKLLLEEPPPDDFVERPEEYNKLLDLVLDRKREQTIAISTTAALSGAGGYGKTTLAKALCHDTQVLTEFKDGIVWVTLGTTPDLTNLVEYLIFKLSNQRPGFSNLQIAASHLAQLLDDRELLIVIDDVWNRSHLEPFLKGGPRCIRLITTRLLEVIPENARMIEVVEMKQAEALEQIGKGIGNDPEWPGLKGEFIALSTRLGEWPFLLKIVNRAIRERVRKGDSLVGALQYAKDSYDESGLKAFQSENEEDRDKAVHVTLGLSFKLLAESELARFRELAIFPEDKQIPLDTVARFWGKTGSLGKAKTEDLCNRLHNLSLLLNFNLRSRTIQLHDVMWKYLNQDQKERLPETHKNLLDSHRPAAGWSDLSETEPYFWDHLAPHLIEAGRGDELVATVKDWRYLAKKTFLRKSLSVENDLIQAEKHAPDDDPLRTLRRSFANSGHLFNHCEKRDDLKSTLLVRLQHLNDLKAIVQELAQELNRPHLSPKFELPDLPHPALIRTLDGHAGSVWSCAFSPDGRRIVSASADKTLKVWDSDSGNLIRTLDGHAGSVWSCAFSPDGRRIVSASADKTLKVWDAQSGDCLATFYADGPMHCCAIYGEMIVAGGALGVYFLKLVE